MQNIAVQIEEDLTLSFSFSQYIQIKSKLWRWSRHSDNLETVIKTIWFKKTLKQISGLTCLNLTFKRCFWSHHISLWCLTLVQMAAWYDISLGYSHIMRTWMCLLSMQSPWMADAISPGYNTDKAWQAAPSRHNRVKLVHRNDWHIITHTSAKHIIEPGS